LENTIKKCSYLIISLLIAIPVMFRGLFFEYDFSVYASIAFAVLAIMVLLSKGVTFSVTTDTSLTVFVALYGVMCLLGVNKGLAVTEFLKYLLIFAIYFAAKSVAKRNSGKTAIMFAVVLAAGVSAIISLFTAAGVLNYPAAYSTSEIEKWLNGTVQYHNAFGALAVCALFIGCALNKEKSKAIKFSNVFFAYFISFGMLMSYSRGAWVTAPFAFIVYMIFADKETRLSFFEIAVTGILSTLAVLSKFTVYVESGDTKSAVLWLFAGLLIYAVLYVLVNALFKYFKEKKYFNITAVVVVAVVLALAVLVVLMPEVFSFILPAQLVERLSGISFGAETAKERFVFYKDALDIAKRSPIFGLGGGAWQDLYGMSQSYYYNSSQAHSFIMQVLVETGILGLLAWIFTLVMFYIKAVKLLISKAADRKILAGTVAGATVLIAHSTIDFDLSISALCIILWAILAVIFAHSSEKEIVINKYASAAACMVLIIPFVTSAISVSAYSKGEEYYQNEQYKLAYEQFEKSSALKPFDAHSLSYKAASKSFYYDGGDERKELVAQMDKAERLAPESMITNQNALTVYSNFGAYEIAMEYAKKALMLQPMNLENYTSYLLSGYHVVSYYYQGENPSLAKKIADDVLSVKDYVEELNTKRTEKIEFTKEMQQMFMYFKVVSYNVGKMQ